MSSTYEVAQVVADYLNTEFSGTFTAERTWDLTTDRKDLSSGDYVVKVAAGPQARENETRSSTQIEHQVQILVLKRADPKNLAVCDAIADVVAEVMRKIDRMDTGLPGVFWLRTELVEAVDYEKLRNEAAYASTVSATFRDEET